MQNKAKTVAISGVCGAVATLCLLLLGIPGASWFALVLAVVASVAISIPMMVSGKAAFSILTYIASAIIGISVGVANILYVAPVVTFCMPMALVKVAGETLKLSTKVQQKTIDDPFGNGDDKKLIAVEVDAKPRMKPVVKWILYYVVLQVGIALTLLATYLFTPTTFQVIIQHNLLWVVIAILQLLPVPYDLLLRGAFALTAKTLRKYLPQE